MPQGHFNVKSNALIENHALQVQKILVHISIPLLRRFRCQAINLALQVDIAWRTAPLRPSGNFRTPRLKSREAKGDNKADVVWTVVYDRIKKIAVQVDTAHASGRNVKINKKSFSTDQKPSSQILLLSCTYKLSQWNPSVLSTETLT